jgi:hypothetical protein
MEADAAATVVVDVDCWLVLQRGLSAVCSRLFEVLA